MADGLLPKQSESGASVSLDTIPFLLVSTSPWPYAVTLGSDMYIIATGHSIDPF